MKHTQGEWFAYYNGHFLEVKVKENKVGSVCSCIFSEVEGSIPESNEQNIANAKLIAAAPEMLKSLIDFTENVDEWLETGEPANPEKSKEIYNQAKKAIEKALK